MNHEVIEAGYTKTYKTCVFMELLCIIAAISFGKIAIAENLLKSKLDYIRNYPVKYVCSDIEVTDREGVITSPNYPSLYSSHLSCSWQILGSAGDVITVIFDDVDIEESCSSLSQPCCLFNWLKVGLLANETEKKVCGKNFYFEPVISSSNKLLIKFHISKFVIGGRGFQLKYKITPRNIVECKDNEMKCSTNQCVNKSLRCNGFPDCEDGLDELHCASSLLPDCKTNELKCGRSQCLPADLRCNGIPDCEDGSDEHHCSNRCPSGRSCHSVFQCYDASKHCDGISDCSDFSDEIDCGFCQENFIRCDSNSSECYNPLTQRCDKVFHCLNGEDEKDCYNLCPGKIMCNSRRGCYPMKYRCNGVAQCEDASDEKNCVPELCNYEHGGFLCDNGRCIQEVWTCDRTDDCGDGSDERNCLRNSVLTAAVMGSLICALLLVIAISCTCRLHALRMLEHRLSSRETPLSRISREFFFREPPPSYAVAVQGSQHHNLYVENLHYGVPVHRGRRRSRRLRHSRGAIIAPQLSSVSRNCVFVNPDGTTAPRPDTANTIGETSNPVPLLDSPPVARPGTKVEGVIPVSGESPGISKDARDDKNVSVQNESICSVITPASDSESLSLEPINTSIEENSDSVHIADHFYCDSDSEPLVA